MKDTDTIYYVAAAQYERVVAENERLREVLTQLIDASEALHHDTCKTKLRATQYDKIEPHLYSVMRIRDKARDVLYANSDSALAACEVRHG